MEHVFRLPKGNRFYSVKPRHKTGLSKSEKELFYDRIRLQIAENFTRDCSKALIDEVLDMPKSLVRLISEEVKNLSVK